MGWLGSVVRKQVRVAHLSDSKRLQTYSTIDHESKIMYGFLHINITMGARLPKDHSQFLSQLHVDVFLWGKSYFFFFKKKKKKKEEEEEEEEEGEKGKKKKQMLTVSPSSGSTWRIFESLLLPTRIFNVFGSSSRC